ncbi:MAG: hypothetical protein A2033_05630 [Bacteroidetes bacterium GWA2_31_9]|nr:MAG: hypothetical protein A2033_05630 [Bacteroidetes bacterium GWA2_31_9]
MYLIKTKGTSRIPDFVQIRDNDFILIEHCKIDSATEFLRNSNIAEKQNIADSINKMPYGVLQKL